MGDFEVEGIRVKDILIKDLIKKEFLEKIEEEKLNLAPVALVFMDFSQTLQLPTILSHQSLNEIKEKVLHINSINSNTVEKIAKIINKLEN